MSAPLEVLTAARFLAATPPTVLNLPPMWAVEQSGLNVMPLTIPFTLGFQEVIVYGLDALKLNTLLRDKVVRACEIAVNVLPAYMVFPHCAICRICSVVPVVASCGVLKAGVVDGGPVAAIAGTAVQAAQAASTPTAAAVLARQLLNNIESPMPIPTSACR